MGTIETGWEQTDGGYRVTVTVPFDTTAALELPDREPMPLTPGRHTVTV
ncbi:MAG: hypothetical protein J6B55_05700 [Clostridia bacterium]|nr:hypothetical protein [Clostridia bacterium]